MRRFGLLASSLTLGSLLTASALAGDIQGLMGIYSEDNAKGYMQPLADVLGATMNSGFYYDARVPQDGFHFHVGLETMFAPVADEDRSFLAHTESEFNLSNPTTTVTAPTIFGDSEGPVVQGTGGTVFTFPGGLQTLRLPLAVPQITVGSIRGTELMARFVDLEVNDSIKDVSLLGLGLRHDLGQYIQRLPMDLSASGFWQSFQVEDFIKAKTLSLGVQTGISRGPFSLFGGLAYETASVDLDYPRGSEDAGTISISLDGRNSLRFTAGGALFLAIVQLHLAYSVASQGVLAAGLQLGR